MHCCFLQVEELKHSLSNLRAQLTSREGELQHLQSTSTPQPGSLSLTAQGNICASSAPQEENLEQKTHVTETSKVNSQNKLISLLYFIFQCIRQFHFEEMVLKSPVSYTLRVKSSL